MFCVLSSGPSDTPRVEPDGDEFYPGQVLTCSGDGRPAVDYYKWIDVSNNDTVIQEGEGEAARLVIQDDWFGASMSVICAVSNEMRDGRVEVHGEEITFSVVSK